MVENREDRVIVSKDGPKGTIVFSNPKKFNAMSITMWSELESALDALDRDDDIRVVVLKGDGERAFVSGADISQFDAVRERPDAQKEYDRLTRSARDRLATFRKPVIAEVRGYCLGGGLAIAMAADIRIAADDAVFGIPAARLGIAYAHDMVRQLLDLVGPGQAKLLLMSGDRIGAAEAARIGLVDRVTGAGGLSEAVAGLAETIGGNAPLSVMGSKTMIAETLDGREGANAELIAGIIDACFASEDFQEGRKAFAEKRKPAFKGR